VTVELLKVSLESAKSNEWFIGLFLFFFFSSTDDYFYKSRGRGGVPPWPGGFRLPGPPGGLCPPDSPPGASPPGHHAGGLRPPDLPSRFVTKDFAYERSVPSIFIRERWFLCRTAIIPIFSIGLRKKIKIRTDPNATDHIAKE